MKSKIMIAGKRPAGFTLIEVILSLAVAVLVLTGTAGIFKQSLDVWQRHNSNAEASLGTQLLAYRMQADIRASALGGDWQSAGSSGINFKMLDGSVVGYEYDQASRQLSRKLNNNSTAATVVAAGVQRFDVKTDVLCQTLRKKYFLYNTTINKQYSDGRIEITSIYSFPRN